MVEMPVGHKLRIAIRDRALLSNLMSASGRKRTLAANVRNGWKCAAIAVSRSL